MDRIEFAGIPPAVGSSRYGKSDNQAEKARLVSWIA